MWSAGSNVRQQKTASIGPGLPETRKSMRADVILETLERQELTPQVHLRLFQEKDTVST